MTKNEYYKIRTPQISHETIEGETVIINLENGKYYSIDGVGADIWNLIDSGAPINKVAEIIRENYGVNKAKIENSLINLVDDLKSEGLITVSDKKNNFDDKKIKLVSKENAENFKYKKPALQKYTDMQDLLLLDPIHEVDDDSGWPTPRDSEIDN